MELLTYADLSTAMGLNFDFGCTVNAIQLRTTDCRNVVALSTFLSSPVAATAEGAVGLTLRNVDMAAEYVLRLTDSTGQTFQYPIYLRSIEQQNPAGWMKARVSLRYPSQYWGGAGDGRPAGNFVSMSLVAAPRNSDSAVLGLNYPKGQVELKSIQFYAKAGASYLLQTNAVTETNGLLPSLDGRLVVAHGAFDLTSLQKAKDAGFSAVRRDMYWDVVERSGAYSFSEFDTGTANLSALGMKALWVLVYGHPDHGGAVPVSSADFTAYANYLNRVAAFGKTRPVLGYEVWNEPHLAGYWPNPDPRAYANLLSTAVTALKQADPAAKIVSGGVAIDEPSYLFALGKTGVLSQVSGVGIHPYRKDTYTITSPSYKRAYSAPEMYANDRLVTKQYLSSAGVTAPLWNTEAGFSTVFFLDPAAYPDALGVAARTRQGQLVLRQVLTQIALNEPLITVYRLQDKGVSATDKEMNFGLLDASGNPKPAYNALKILTSLVKDMQFNGTHLDVPPGLHALRWSSGTGKVFCLWADHAGEDFTVTLPLGVKQVKTWDGVTVTPQTVGGNQVVTVRESAGPLYLVF